MNRHHAFAIEATAGEGIAIAKNWLREELGMGLGNNPDILAFEYGLLSVEEARRIGEAAAGAPFVGKHKAIIIAASRAYHEAQNALLKLFEEPPPNTYLFLILPTLGGLVPTLRSRVQELQKTENGKQKTVLPEIAEEFLKGNKEKRGTIIHNLTIGTDEEERRENREEAILLMGGIEQAAYRSKRTDTATTALLYDIATLRVYLHDRSAPVKQILEHISLVIPSGLL